MKTKDTKVLAYKTSS